MAKAPKKMRTIEDVREVASAILAEHIETFDEDEFREKIQREMDAAALSIVMSGLGFSKRWSSGWEVDHCNGHHGVAGKIMMEAGRLAAEDWLRNAVGDLPALPKSAVSSLKREYLEQLERELSDKLRDLAVHEARKMAAEISLDIGLN